MTFTCKVCHQDFANRSEFLFHTRTDEHKAIKEAEEQALREPKLSETFGKVNMPQEAENVFSGFNMPAEEMAKQKLTPSNLIIPTNFLPPEVKYLKSGTFVGVKVFGKYTKENGLTVQSVELIR